MIAPVERDLFNESVAAMREMMRVGLLEQVEPWQSVFAQMGLEGDIERLVNSKLDAFQDDMTFAAIDLFMNHADDLKIADNAWRAANSEQALLEPLG